MMITLPTLRQAIESRDGTTLAGFMPMTRCCASSTRTTPRANQWKLEAATRSLHIMMMSADGR